MDNLHFLEMPEDLGPAVREPFQCNMCAHQFSMQTFRALMARISQVYCVRCGGWAYPKDPVAHQLHSIPEKKAWEAKINSLKEGTDND